MSSMTILFAMFQITDIRIRPQVNQAASLMIADGHVNLPQKFV